MLYSSSFYDNLWSSIIISFTGALVKDGKSIFISILGLGKSPGKIGVFGELKVYIIILGSAIYGIIPGIKLVC